MADQLEPQINSETAASDAASLPDPKLTLDALIAAKSQADSLIAAIQGQTQIASAKSNEIEQDRILAEKARSHIDAQLISMKEIVAVLAQQVDIARNSGAELSTLSASIQAANSQNKETASQATAALESARALADAAGKSAGLIEALKAQVEQSAQVTEKRSAHIEDGRKHADEVRARIDQLFTQAQESANNAEAQHQTSRSSVENINSLYTTAQTVKANTDSNAEVVAKTRATVEGHAATTKRLADISESTEARIAQYEARLATLHDESEKQRKIIDELLLGATNAGLASAFDRRSKMFKSPERFWQWVFIGSLAGLLGLAIWQTIVYGSMGQPPDWQQLVRMLLFKLPFLVPLVWLAIHATRQASFAKRMEEEYAFKATTSMSFEGYRRQMAEVGKDLAADSPLAQLCNNTLRIIAAPPGNVYDKQRMDPTPGTAAADIIGPVVEGVSKTLASKLTNPKG